MDKAEKFWYFCVNSSGCKLPTKEQLIRLRDLEGRIVEDDLGMCEEMSNRFKSVFIGEDTIAQRNGKEILESTGISRRYFDKGIQTSSNSSRPLGHNEAVCDRKRCQKLTD